MDGPGGQVLPRSPHALACVITAAYSVSHRACATFTCRANARSHLFLRPCNTSCRLLCVMVSRLSSATLVKHGSDIASPSTLHVKYAAAIHDTRMALLPLTIACIVAGSVSAAVDLLLTAAEYCVQPTGTHPLLTLVRVIRSCSSQKAP